MNNEPLYAIMYNDGFGMDKEICRFLNKESCYTYFETLKERVLTGDVDYYIKEIYSEAE